MVEARREFRSGDAWRQKDGEDALRIDCWKSMHGVSSEGGGKGWNHVVLHAFGTTSPVAIVEIKPFALQNECADAILGGTLVGKF